MNIIGTVLPYVKFSTYILDEEDGYAAIELKMVEAGWLGQRYGFIYSAQEIEA
jgi:hypothetical protein